MNRYRITWSDGEEEIVSMKDSAGAILQSWDWPSSQARPVIIERLDAE